MSQHISRILIGIAIVLACVIIAYYSSGGTLTIRSFLEDSERSPQQKNTSLEIATSTKEQTKEEPQATSSKQQEGNTGDGRIKEETENFIIDVEYPTSGLGSEEVRQSILEEVRIFKKNVAEVAREQTIKRKRHLKIDFQIFTTEKYVSYKVSSYIYRGGASGIGMADTFVFTKSGSPATLEELVSESKREEFTKAVLSKIREVNDVDENEDLRFSVSYQDFINFYVTEKNLVLLFDEYSVAPGAAGVVQIKIDRNILR